MFETGTQTTAEYENGYRQSEARLGETACVIGLGLVGQLAARIAAARCHTPGRPSTSSTAAASNGSSP